MKKVIFIFAMFFIMPLVADAEQVDGYWRDSDGDGIKDKYVNPYNRSNKNDSIWDNYGTKGNTNPYTGEKGTVDPFKQHDYNNNPYNYNNNRKSDDYDSGYGSSKSHQKKWK